MNVIEYIKKQRKVHLPYVANKFDIDVFLLTQFIIDNKLLGHFDRGMYCLGVDYYDWYYEMCNSKYDRGKFCKEKDLTFNRKKDQHHSVFLHDKNWVEYASQTKKVNAKNTLVKPKYIYLELDRDHLNDAITDALKIYYSFEHNDYVQLWYSGNNSIHIYVDAGLFGSPIDYSDKVCGVGKLYYNLAHEICGDVRYSNNLTDSWTASRKTVEKEYRRLFNTNSKDLQQIRQKLENIDPNLFRLNSLIRLPESTHEKSGNRKIQLCPKELMRGNFVETKVRNYADFPYLLDWTVKCYEPKIRKKEINAVQNQSLVIEEFSKYIDGFDVDTADSNGWVSKCYSPFYDDTNPSVSVNINTGMYWDWGNPVDQFGFIEFLRRIHFNEHTKTS